MGSVGVGDGVGLIVGDGLGLGLTTTDGLGVVPAPGWRTRPERLPTASAPTTAAVTTAAAARPRAGIPQLAIEPEKRAHHPTAGSGSASMAAWMRDARSTGGLELCPEA